MSAELNSAEDAPRVGKAQHSNALQSGDSSMADVDEKDAPRRDERKRGGGFTGWK
jgi:hypothetical protein